MKIKNTKKYFSFLLSFGLLYSVVISALLFGFLYSENSDASSINVSPLKNLKSGLVGYWTMDGKDTPWTSSSAATTKDKSGNGNTGTLTNMSRATGTAAGKIGQALNFDGTNDYVKISGNGNIIGDERSFTLEAWVKPESSKNQRIIENLHGGAFGSDRYGYKLQINNATNTVVFYTVGTTMRDNNITSDITLTINAWSHIAAVRNLSAGTLSVYINGVGKTVNETYSGSRDHGDGQLNIGGYYSHSPASSAYVDGLIDEVRIYNRALSASEVTALYNLGR